MKFLTIAINQSWISYYDTRLWHHLTVWWKNIICHSCCHMTVSYCHYDISLLLLIILAQRILVYTISIWIIRCTINLLDIVFHFHFLLINELITINCYQFILFLLSWWLFCLQKRYIRWMTVNARISTATMTQSDKYATKDQIVIVDCHSRLS
jgi:hypothetical protein